MAHERRKLLVAAALSTGLLAASAAPSLAGGELCRHARPAAAAQAQPAAAGGALIALTTVVAGGTATVSALRERSVSLIASVKSHWMVGNGKRPMYDEATADQASFVLLDTPSVLAEAADAK